MVLARKKNVELKIAKLQQHLEHIHFKADYDEAACKAGTEAELKKRKYPSLFKL
ncbi:transcriptional regulator, MerR family [Anoxybacillus sp. B7M1]|nr:transcriptional regulator, MerR family [Anoxybacillus sp. B2M1]ANB65948.1 transcriptional regulator, MerR family [Anoxybacillus sp. B7M1]